MSTILLIPGHGGDDPGAVNPQLSDENTEEEDINLNVAIALREQLRAKGHQVLMSRDRDFYVAPADQLRLIRETKPDCAIAIHCNASSDDGIEGVETFYRDEYDLPLARQVHRYLVVYTARKDRGVHQDVKYLKRHLAVLSDYKCPACLVELAYITNPDDFDYITENPQTLAQAIEEGITEWAS